MAREDLSITMPDGVRLAASLYLPEVEAPWPVLLEALPYRKDDLTAHYASEYERFAAEYGYAVCRLDIRGTGSSEGLPQGEYTAQELDDLEVVIDWLATRDWSNGNVGMYGTSWSGFNSLAVAMRRPPALKAICSIFASDDRYADDVHYFGGALKQLDLVDWPLYMFVENVLPPVPSVYGDGWREQWELRMREGEPFALRQLEEQTYSGYWKQSSLREDYGAIEAATMLVCGWADGYKNISLRGMASMRCPRRLLFGPWSHASTETCLPGPNADIVPEMARWWDRWLRGIDNGVDREPPITLFARRATKPAADLKEMNGEWRFEPGWPLERGGELPMPLGNAHTPGRSARPIDELEVRGDVGWTAWISCAGGLPWGQPIDQRADEAYSLVYEWGPVEREIEILGYPRLEVTVTSSAPVAYLSAKLCDVFPDGTSALVTRGLLNLTHRDSREEPSALEPGRPYRVTFELEVASWAFEPGHRIRLDLAGADWPNAWPPPGPVTLTIERAGSAIVLPTVEGPSPIAERPVLPPPTRQAHPLESSRGTEMPSVTWRIEHDIVAKETRAVTAYGGASEAADGRPGTEEWYEGTVGVSTEDPAVAWVDARATNTLRFPEVTVAGRIHWTIRSDADAYHVDIDAEVDEDGDPRWSRRWERRVPRRLQ
jgi:putative CocE/NonD family hydrolase